MVLPVGLEPTIYELKARCRNQFGYGSNMLLTYVATDGGTHEHRSMENALTLYYTEAPKSTVFLFDQTILKLAYNRAFYNLFRFF